MTCSTYPASVRSDISDLVISGDGKDHPIEGGTITYRRQGEEVYILRNITDGREAGASVKTLARIPSCADGVCLGAGMQPEITVDPGPGNKPHHVFISYFYCSGKDAAPEIAYSTTVEVPSSVSPNRLTAIAARQIAAMSLYAEIQRREDIEQHKDAIQKEVNAVADAFKQLSLPFPLQ